MNKIITAAGKNQVITRQGNDLVTAGGANQQVFIGRAFQRTQQIAADLKLDLARTAGPLVIGNGVVERLHAGCPFRHFNHNPTISEQAHGSSRWIAHPGQAQRIPIHIQIIGQQGGNFHHEGHICGGAVADIVIGNRGVIDRGDNH